MLQMVKNNYHVYKMVIIMVTRISHVLPSTQGKPIYKQVQVVNIGADLVWWGCSMVTHIESFRSHPLSMNPC